MVNPMLVSLLDSVLGTGIDRKTTNDRKYYCPFPSCRGHHKAKLEVQLITDENGENPWRCWVCDEKGKSIFSLFKKLQVPQETLDKLKTIVKSTRFTRSKRQEGSVILPPEYKSLYNISSKNIMAKHAMIYLKKRGITPDDIKKYDIGFCDEGEYKDMIIIPSYDEIGQLNYFIGRSFSESKIKYKYPPVSRDIIPFELFINWNVPINLCEGFFDMAAIKRNCIPLLGKNIQSALMKKLLSSKCNKIFISLDPDALEQALRHAETLLSHGKKVYLIEISAKDPGELGFVEYTKLVQKARGLTLSKIMELRLNHNLCRKSNYSKRTPDMTEN